MVFVSYFLSLHIVCGKCSDGKPGVMYGYCSGYHMMTEGQEKDEFWSVLGGKGEYSNSPRLQVQYFWVFLQKKTPPIWNYKIKCKKVLNFEIFLNGLVCTLSSFGLLAWVYTGCSDVAFVVLCEMILDSESV